jgi:hypothetical protein
MTAMDKVAALRAKLAQQREEVAVLKEFFSEFFPEEEWLVSDSQFGIWIRQYGLDAALIGLEEAAKKLSKVNQEIEEGKDVEPWFQLNLVKFSSWVMSNEKKKAELK